MIYNPLLDVFINAKVIVNTKQCIQQKNIENKNVNNSHSSLFTFGLLAFCVSFLSPSSHM